MRRISKIFSFYLLYIVLKVQANLPKDRKILVIGAGASGIAATSKLLENEYMNVLLLEASDRIGGRINSVKFGDGFVDLGAQWIHGQDGNILYDMVKNYNLTDITPDSFWTGWKISSEGEMKIGYEILSNISRRIYYEEKDKCKYVSSISHGNFFHERYGDNSFIEINLISFLNS